MKKILITGANSYIGTSFEKWVLQYPEKYSVDTIDMKEETWREKSFKGYDVVFHVAGIAHVSSNPRMKDLYYKVNRDLTIEAAKKAKAEGVKQFIFMSSMSVYGINGLIGEDIVITRDTPCKPNTLYGRSKLEAEKELKKLEDKHFRIAIIRAPMVYGPNCPGNYTRLKELVIKTPVFPMINNKRSMIFIDNLSEFIRLLIENQEKGLFFPQNKEYVDIVELVRLIAKKNKKNMYFSRSLGFGIKFLGKRISVFKKVFGNLVFDLNLSSYKDFEYNIVDFEKSIECCEIDRKKRC